MSNVAGNKAKEPTTSEPNALALSGLLREGMVSGHMPFLTVSSGSMTPLLRVGDEVGVQPVSPHQLHPGDVIVVLDRNLILTHRFIGLQNHKSGDVIVTRGDRSLIIDRPWTEGQLLGRAVVRRRKGHTLWLDFGKGYWLNRLLAQLSQFEHNLLRHVSSYGASQTLRLAERLVRAIFRRLAGALTFATEWAL